MEEDASARIKAVAVEVARLMDEAFAAVDYRPKAGSSLDQLNLLGGEAVVSDYLAHGEPGVALDHLLYMIEEPPLQISQSAYDQLSAAALALCVPLSRLDPVRPT